MPFYVLKTAPQLEFKAQQALEDRGHSVILPFYHRELKRRFSHKDGVVPPAPIRKDPIMRQYLIVEALNGDAVGSIVYSMTYAPRRLITGYLGSYGNPIAIPYQHFEAVHLMSGQKINAGPDIQVWAAGKSVRVASGPFQGQTSTIKSVRGDKVKLLMQWMGSQREVEIPARLLEAV